MPGSLSESAGDALRDAHLGKGIEVLPEGRVTLHLLQLGRRISPYDLEVEVSVLC